LHLESCCCHSPLELLRAVVSWLAIALAAALGLFDPAIAELKLL
jgi:hypothetical protein